MYFFLDKTKSVEVNQRWDPCKNCSIR